MQIAIVDDDAQEIQRLQGLIHDFMTVNRLDAQILTYANAESFLSEFQSGRFDVIFMDIYMEEMSGVEAAGRVRALDNRVFLIFLTSSMEHMADAFSCHAFEYVEKPAAFERIAGILTDIITLLPATSRYIDLTIDRQDIRLFYSDILSAVSNNHMILFSDQFGEHYSIRRNFSEMSDLLLQDRRFLQINKGIIVNMDFISELKQSSCALSDGELLPVKIRDRAKIEQTYSQYCFEKLRGERGMDV
ncbi:MAG: LytTR family DNA-binding domain-containing protein [bacterium]|nr:LytTR family DNA-binding domain-containing protein [bacterium]